jgi:hypothetical protein
MAWSRERKLVIRQFSDETDATETSLPTAIEAIEKEGKHEGNFIGFTNDSDETIQFIRVEPDDWLVDVPVYVNGEYANYSMKAVATMPQVKQMVELFFQGGKWRDVVELEDSRRSDATEFLCIKCDKPLRKVVRTEREVMELVEVNRSFPRLSETPFDEQAIRKVIGEPMLVCDRCSESMPEHYLLYLRKLIDSIRPLLQGNAKGITARDAYSALGIQEWEAREGLKLLVERGEAKREQKPALNSAGRLQNIYFWTPIKPAS